MSAPRDLVKLLDSSTVIAVVGVALLLAYLESRGGLGKALAQAGVDEGAKIQVQDSNLDRAVPPVDGPSTPSKVGDPFLQPIEASMGGSSPFVPLMSATQYGAIKLNAAEYQDPQKASLFNAIDGRVFVALPSSQLNRSDMSAGGRHATSGDTKPVPDPFRAFSDWLFPTGEPKPRVAAVS